MPTVFSPALAALATRAALALVVTAAAAASGKGTGTAAASAAAAAAFSVTNPSPLLHSGLHDPVGSVQGLIERVLGESYVHSFTLVPIPRDTATGYDVFELDYAAGNRTVVVRGNAGYSLAAGLNWYLKYTLNCSATWGRRADDGSLTGNQLSALPRPDALIPPSEGCVR
jgi:hypothetical protein